MSLDNPVRSPDLSDRSGLVLWLPACVCGKHCSLTASGGRVQFWGNAALHLVLDALQTKWGSGVHFFAPVSWTSTNWGLFWPESIVTYGLTTLGV